MGRAVWREMSVPALLILIIFVLEYTAGTTLPMCLDACECTGEMDSDHWPPCSADYGKGLPDDLTKRLLVWLEEKDQVMQDHANTHSQAGDLSSGSVEIVEKDFAEDDVEI